MKKLLLILTFLFSLTTAWALDIFESKISANEAVSLYPNFENAHCKFSQERLMKTNNISLQSGGNFTFLKNKGVIFETTYPIQSTATYTDSNNKNVASVIKAVSDKNFAYIEKNFDIYHTETSPINWILGLKPKTTGQLKNELDSIQIYGITNSDKAIITKIIFDTKVTKTTINFKDCK